MTASIDLAPPHRTPFAGREAERAELRRALERCAGRQGGFVLLLAEAGMGKTRLCDGLAGAAQSAGMLHLAGQCLEGDAGIPYLPIAEIVEAAARTLSPDDLLAATAAARPQLAIIAPQLRTLLPDDAAADGGAAARPPEHERPALFAAIRDFLDRLSRRSPLLLIVEDVHWADASTLLLLRHLVRFVAQRRILIVATCRTSDDATADAVASGVDALVSDLQREASGSVLELTDLTLDDATAMVHSITGREPPPSIAAALFRRTGGNPLFIEQVVKHLAEEDRLFDDRGRWRE
ncbi:MAG TPA: AAA family ATPase, partial [Candidatus Limnocylindria bacterium]|nr:AAA family ATPase [Candidatus Limnocylindria bacterium]